LLQRVVKAIRINKAVQHDYVEFLFCKELHFRVWSVVLKRSEERYLCVIF